MRDRRTGGQGGEEGGIHFKTIVTSFVCAYMLYSKFIGVRALGGGGEWGGATGRSREVREVHTSNYLCKLTPNTYSTLLKESQPDLGPFSFSIKLQSTIPSVSRRLVWFQVVFLQCISCSEGRRRREIGSLDVLGEGVGLFALTVGSASSWCVPRSAQVDLHGCLAAGVRLSFCSFFWCFWC